MAKFTSMLLLMLVVCCIFQLIDSLGNLFNSASKLKTVTVFGASGGIGQLICNKLKNSYRVCAVSRSAASLSSFDLLDGCQFVQADARIPSTLKEVLKDTDYLVISVGTTAFPTKKWDNGNTPEEACFMTVKNILEALPQRKVPEKIILLSSIGVDRVDQFPFKILNAYGVLDAKKRSEELVLNYSRKASSSAVIIRPGRLIGAPFTNFDLAKLLKLEQTANKAIVFDTDDVLAGDTERADVAEVVRRLIPAKLSSKQTVFSVVNSKGASPSEKEWSDLFASI